jgi:hypothetical protein
MTELDKFLEELTTLTKKYKLEIGGCGCCGSPYVEKTQDEHPYLKYTTNDKGDYLTYE